MATVASGQLTLTDLNDTKQLILYLNANYKSQIYDPTASSYTPSFSSSNLTITPELYIAGGTGANMLPSTQVKSITWYEGTQTSTAIAENATGGTTTAGYTYTLPTGAVGTTSKVLTIKSNLSATQIYTCVIVYTDPDTSFDITIKANVEIQRIQNGAKGNVGTNSITSFLSNSSVSLATSNTGTVTYANCGTDIYVYDGTTALTYDGVGTANGKFKVTASGSSITAGGITASASGTARAVVANASAITANTASITYTVVGKSLTGADINVTLVQSFNKSINGTDGTSPSSYWITTDYAVISKAKNTGTITPATVVATGNTQQGTGTVSRSTTFKWVVDTSTDGSTFTNNVASPTSASTASQATNVANLKAVRFRMYLNSVTPSTSNFLDEQIIWVVAEGNDGNDSYFLNVWTPKGDAIRNSSGSLDIQSDLYKGSALSADTITYKWYVQDANATTASGGDADGGNGWRLITSSNASTYGATNYSTKTISITQAGIAGVTGWKGVAKVGSTVYSGVVVLRDFQDPVTVNILGASIFKNGEGSVTLQAQLIQAGVVIPNTGYTFQWALYDTAGSLIKTYADTDDTVVIPATDVTGTANVVCTANK